MVNISSCNSNKLKLFDAVSNFKECEGVGKSSTFEKVAEQLPL